MVTIEEVTAAMREVPEAVEVLDARRTLRGPHSRHARLAEAAKVCRGLSTPSARRATQLHRALEASWWDMVKPHVGFARMMARRICTATYTEDDAFQDGLLGLLDAAKRFDPNRGIPFLTYARWWIRISQQRSDGAAYVVARTDRAYIGRSSVREALRSGYSEEDVAQFFRMSIGNLRSVVAGISLTGIYQPEAEDEEVFSHPDEGPEDLVIRKLDFDRVTRRMKDRLKDDDVEILLSSFGIGREPQSNVELGLARGVSRERIRQRRARALTTLAAGAK